MEEIYRKPSFVIANKDMEQGGCGVAVNGCEISYDIMTYHDFMVYPLVI